MRVSPLHVDVVLWPKYSKEGSYRYHSFATEWTTNFPLRLCHTAAILSRETKKALFYHAEPRSQNRGGEAKRGKTKLFWSPGTIWPPCDKGDFTILGPKNNVHMQRANPHTTTLMWL